MPTSTQCRAADARSAPRTSLYLAAALYRDGSSSPVRIRNISATGALLEGAVVPGSGTLIQLIRGGLIVHGLIAWSMPGRCGVKFSGQVDLQRWRASPTNTDQERVDDVVRLVKAGVVPLPFPSLGQSGRPCSEIPEHGAALAGDLRRVCELLDKLGEDLANDSEVVMRHGRTLQGLDISVQLVAVIEALVAEDPQVDFGPAKLEALRRSADQALKRCAPVAAQDPPSVS